MRASSNDTSIAYLKKCFKHAFVLDGDFVHVSCCAHILNLIVCDGLKDVNDTLIRIRNVVRFVDLLLLYVLNLRSALRRRTYLVRVCCVLKRDAVEKFEKEFERLEDYDTIYMNDECKPTSKDWEITRIFTKFLYVFFEVTIRLSGSLYVTFNSVFHEISIVHNCIKKYASVGGHDNKLLHDMTLKMQEKYDKYWGKIVKTNFFLYVAFFWIHVTR